MQQKVNGFTLLEAMVALLLSSILVVFTFSLYHNFNQYYFIYAQQTERLNTILHFKQTFNQDWNKALLITSSEKQLFLANHQQTITYDFLDSTIVRTGNIATTFHLIPTAFSSRSNFNNEKITQIELEVDHNQQHFVFSSSKSYGIKDQVLIHKQ
ncbi:MAG: prepilin-type N-terminal cleavage/methylation domain-containing protein [Flavobacteriales bacterium]|jgi:prepilin-type N-terminal cleavage/methylation domain-containing protein|nr:prepilin-type N-terminal cleavage/methylation domain-containing protein [Flavobacteriales bacterium]